MKDTECLADGQIVSHKGKWLICYKAADNHLLFGFSDYMEIYNNAWQAADVLANYRFVGQAIGIIGEINPCFAGYLCSFAHKKDIIATSARAIFDALQIGGSIP